jgi:hypothetical protein
MPTTTTTPVVRHTAYYATTADGQWGIERLDVTTTPWEITHLPTGVVVDCWYPTLDRAITAIADGTATAMLPTPPAEAPELCRPAATSKPLKLAPAAKGTTTTMTDPERDVIVYATTTGDGTIRRGRGYGAADLLMMQAMARRGFVTLTGPRYRPTGAAVTVYGRLIAGIDQTAAAV